MNILVEAYNNIKEMPEVIRTTASMVPVIESQGNYVVETNYLIPFMRENGIETVEEALDMVAEANGLEPKHVGLVVAAQDGINSLSESEVSEAVEAKLEGFLRMADRLLENGYPVFKKISAIYEDAHGPNCHCAECTAKRECGNAKRECNDANTPKDECGGSGKGKKDECGDGNMSAGSFNGNV